MSIEIFEKAATSISSIGDLLKDAGFTDARWVGSNSFSSSSGVYGITSFNVYDGISGFSKFIAVKDDSRKALIVFQSGANIGDVATTYGAYFFSLLIVDGVMCDMPNNNPLSAYYNAVGGPIKSTSDTSQVILAPFIDTYDHVLKPFYISVNRVNFPINTIVTDGSNSFTSLGNLFYIKNA